MFGTDPRQRREALAALQGRRLEIEDVEAVGQLILSDPDPEVRALAVRALDKAAGELPFRLVERGLQDPDDSVRAAMVRVAAERCPRAAPLIVRLAVRRRWPMAQFAALERLPDLLGAEPSLSEENIETLLSGLAAMEPPPLESERSALSEVARSIGGDRLAVELRRPGPRRLGAVLLLLMEGSEGSLRHIAPLADDPLEGVRQVALAAINMLGSSGNGDGGAHEDQASDPTPEEIIAALATAMADPDQGVRTRCREALERVRRGAVVAWVDRTLREGDDRTAARAAAVAEALHLHPTAAALLARASSLPPEARGPYVGALDALRVDPDQLGELVASVTPAHRPEALRLAWIVGGRHAIPLVRSLALDPAGSVRMAALEILAEAADPSAITLARRALDQDSSAVVRATAVRLLARSGGTARVEALEGAMADPDPDVRATALEAMPRELSSQASQLLLRALRDEDERVWRSTLPHVGRLGDRDLPGLWEAFRESDAAKREEVARALERSNGGRLARLARTNAAAVDWADRALAVDLAARAGTEEGTRIVIEALEDPDPVVRRAAATALSSLRTVLAVPALSRSLSDPQADVRVEAVRALGLTDDESVLPVLIAALKDPSPRVRDLAGESLIRWRSPSVARRLGEALAFPDLRRPVLPLLAAMGQTAVGPLVDLVIEADREVAIVAGGLLESIAGPEPFLRQLSSRQSQDRIRAVEVLGAIDGPSASEWLLASLADPDQVVRERVVVLLGDLGDPRAVEPLKQVFLGDPVGDVATAAQEALRKLGGMPADESAPADGGPEPALGIDQEHSEGLSPPPEP